MSLLTGRKREGVGVRGKCERVREGHGRRGGKEEDIYIKAYSISFIFQQPVIQIH